jgi:hypothetical protein
MNSDWRSYKDAAHQTILELRKNPRLSESNVKLLKRLDNYPQMKSDVWQKIAGHSRAEHCRSRSPADICCTQYCLRLSATLSERQKENYRI